MMWHFANTIKPTSKIWSLDNKCEHLVGITNNLQIKYSTKLIGNIGDNKFENFGDQAL